MNFEEISRKITRVLFTTQSLASASFIASSTLNSIVGKELSNNPSWAGVPMAIYLVFNAMSAFGWGYVYDAIGRRLGMVTGLLLGVTGSSIAFIAIKDGSFNEFMLGMVFLGMSRSATDLGRYAAAEVNPPDQRGRAISNVVLGGTIGAVIGPLAAGNAGKIVIPWGINELGGAYFVMIFLFAIGAAVIFFGLKPDPRDVGRELAKLYPHARTGSGVVRTVMEIYREPAVRVAAVSMLFGQMVMVLVMVITSLHMRDHKHGLTDISLVISSHTFGMFAFSIFSGRLADRWGRERVILIGSTTLILACVAATFSPDVLPLGVALFLLGLGWNFCFVGGSTLLSDQLSPLERSRIQGFNDFVVGLAAALGSLESGFIFSTLGYNLMAYVSAAVAFIPLIVVLFWMNRRRVVEVA